MPFNVLDEDDKSYTVEPSSGGGSIVIAKNGISPELQTFIESRKPAPVADLESPSTGIGGASGDWSGPADAGGVQTQSAASPKPSEAGHIDVSQLALPAKQVSASPSYDPLKTIQKGIGLQQAGITNEAKAQAQAAQETTQNLSDLSTNVEKQQKQMADSRLKRETDAKAALDDYNQAVKDYQALKPDPNRYWSNLSTGGKIAAAVGIALGGIGQGLSKSNSNAALDVIHSAIQRDFEAQKLEADSKRGVAADKMNLLQFMRQKYGDEQTAEQATIAAMYQQADLKNKQIISKYAGPEALAKGQQLSGALTTQASQHLDAAYQMVTKRNALAKLQEGNTGGADPAGLVPLLVPAEHQKKAFDEIEAAENTRKMAHSILSSFEQAANENTVFMTGAGMIRTPASVYSLHQAMQPTFKDLEGTVRQAAMENTFKNITPAPGDTEKTISVKRAALRDYLQSKLSAPTARAYGLDLTKFNRTAPPVNFKPSK